MICNDLNIDTISGSTNDYPRLLVLVRNAKDLSLIKQFLPQKYFIIGHGSDIGNRKFDLCILDQFSFQKNKEELRMRKNKAAPIFLPILLLSETKNHVQSTFSEYADDVVKIPTSSHVLESRIQSLLRQRKYSLKLQEQNKELEQSLREKDVLLKEIHHRVKNNLAVVSGLLKIQRYNTLDEDLRLILSNCEMRIKSMALIHETLYQSESLSNINFPEYLNDLVEGIKKTRNMDESIELNVSSDAMFLNVNQAIPCGLIINELVSNSLEHAFKKNKSGKISIEAVSKSDIVEIAVRDNGSGISREKFYGKKQSMGFTIVETLVKQLGTDLIIKNQNGCNMSFEFRKEKISGSSSNFI